MTMFRNLYTMYFGIFIVYRKDFIAELIAKTKQQRYNKKLARDEHEDAIERLDEKWNKIQQTNEMANFIRPAKDKLNISGPEKDDYDHMVSLYSNLKYYTYSAVFQSFLFVWKYHQR